MAKSKIATAYVQVAPSAEGIKGKLSGIFGKEMPGAGASAGSAFGSSMMSKLKGVIAAAGIGKMLSESLQAGADLQQSLGGVETLFKDSADTVIKNAEQAYKTAGMSANEYMETVTGFSASLLQSLGGDTAEAAKMADMALTDMSDNSNKMGTDMELIKNAYQGFAKQNYTMLDNLKLGYGGTQKEMMRLLEDAQKLSGVEYDISKLSDVYEAIHVIQEEMDITGTTAKEASSTFSGSMASMKAAFSDVLANLSTGRDIGPSLEALGETVYTFVEGNLLPMLGNILSALPDMLGKVLDLAIDGLSKVVSSSNGIVKTGTGFIGKLAKVIVSAIPKLVTVARELVRSLADMILSTDWAGLLSDIASFIAEGFGSSSGEMLDIGSDVAGALIDGAVSGLPRFLKLGTQMLKTTMDSIAGGLPKMVRSGADLLRSVVKGIGDALPMVLDAAEEIIASLIEGILDTLPDIIETALGLVDEIVGAIDSALPDILETGVTLIEELVAGISQALPQLFEAALSVLMTVVDTIIDNLPQILEAGKEILLELIKGIREALPKMVDAAGDALVSLVEGIVENLPEIVAAGIDLIASLIQGLGEAIPDLIAAGGELAQKLWDAIASIDWVQLGKDIVWGIATGVSDFSKGGIGSAIGDMCTSTFDAVKDFFGIASPSKLMRDEIGRFIPAGIAIGVEANTKPLTDSLHALADTTTGTLAADLSGGSLRSSVVSPYQQAGNTTIQINVYGAQGQSVDELAELLMQKLQFEYGKREAALR